MFKRKVDVLDKYMEDNKDLPKQGTPEWLDARGIGGSDLHNLIKNESSFVLQSLRPRQNLDHIFPINWGNFLEDSARRVATKIFSTDIRETGSVQSVAVKGKTYSADGVGVVDYDGEAKVTLFEYKCPTTRVIKQGIVPPHYIPQIMSGMSDIPIIDNGLFIECSFRMSNLQSLIADKPIDNIDLHKLDDKKSMCSFVLGIYLKEVDKIDELKELSSTMCELLSNGPRDISNILDKQDINLLFQYVRKGVIGVWYGNLNMVSDELNRCDYLKKHPPLGMDRVDMYNEVKTYFKYCKDNSIHNIGILGFRLVDLNIVNLEKDADYTTRYTELIQRSIVNINLIKAETDPQKKIDLYNYIYGVNGIINTSGRKSKDIKSIDKVDDNQSVDDELGYKHINALELFGDEVEEESD
jgi:hypothetical protein